MRLTTSRPTWSVPIGYARPGATWTGTRLSASRMICRGWYRENTGASAAVTTRARTMSPPIAPRGFRCANEATAVQGVPGIALLVPDPGIEHAVGEIDQQVEDQHDHGHN